MTIRLQLILGFLVLSSIFVIVFFTNQRLSEEVLTNTTYLNNSETIIRNSNMIHKEIIEMQSGFRGFLLTNQESFLQPYYEGYKSVPALLKEQRALLSAEKQKQRLDSIFVLHKEWIEYADSLISTKKDTMPESGIRYQRLFNNKLKMEVGKKLNDRIHAMFTSFDNYEYEVRQDRRIALQKSIKSTRNISLGLMIGSILLSLLSGIYLIRMIVVRISKMVTMAERVSTGNFVVITDKKKDEFARLVEALNQMSETLDKNFKELKKKNSELDQFAYVVSHDLKAPLRGITNLIDWIEEDNETEISPAIAHNLERIKGRTNRLESMINGLLEYAKIGKIKKATEEVDTEKVIADVVELVVPERYEVQIIGTLPIIAAEKLQVEQVFSNLISNAVKHNKRPAGKIVISTKELEDFYEFSITDNGPGIEKEYFDRIFVIFQTLQERDAFESTGVGLAIVKKIIEDNKGTISVKSIMGEGSTFTFTWPKKQ